VPTEYLMLDEQGNGVDSFDDEASARAALLEEFAADPVAAAGLIVLPYDDSGRVVGEAITIERLAGHRLESSAFQEPTHLAFEATTAGLTIGIASGPLVHRDLIGLVVIVADDRLGHRWDWPSRAAGGLRYELGAPTRAVPAILPVPNAR